VAQPNNHSGLSAMRENMRSSQRFFRAAVAAALLTSSLAFASVESTSLASHVWIHGAVDCSESRDPAIETFKVDEDTYILRQSKCVDYEAPFIYVLFGEQTVLVQDTGATSEADKFPLYDTVAELVRNRPPRTETALEVLVIHSHSHGDHTAADAQFRGKPNVTVVAPGKRGLDPHTEHHGLSRSNSRTISSATDAADVKDMDETIR